jgi:FAD/FMN-containing dehydrogenase
MSEEARAQRPARARPQGEVLFDAASRGRYATDASIYQIMPVGVFVPKTARRRRDRDRHRRATEAPLLPRGGGTRSADRRRARRSSSTPASICARWARSTS